MEWLWVVMVTALLTFCMIVAYRQGFRKGYKKGAEFVLDEWKEVMERTEE